VPAKLVLAVAMVVAAAALPQAALGFSPRLLVTAGGPPGATTIEVGDPDGATAGVVVYVPPGYSVGRSPAPGERVGRVPSATVTAAGLRVDLRGELRVTDPVAETTRSCTPGPHLSTMLLTLHAPGLDVSMPAELDRASSTEAGYAAYRLTLCSDEAPATRLVALRLVLDHLFRAPSAPARHVWRGVFTPFSAQGVPEPAAAAESRSVLPLPVRLVLRGSYDVTRGAVALRGSLRAGGEPVAGQRIRLFAGPGARPTRRSGSVTTGLEGRFEATRGMTSATTFRATAALPPRDVTATDCRDPIAPGGCVAAVLAPQQAQSAAVHVRLPAPIQYGSRGALVRKLQTELIGLRYLPTGAAGGTFDDRTWHAVVAFQGWQGLSRDGVVGPQVWRALGRAHPPRPWGGMRNGLEVDTARQVLFLVSGGRVVRAIHVSTGAGGRTPLGHFSVYRKELLSWSVPFKTWMPYASYFYGGFAMHSYSSVPAYPASHGCVRLPSVEAPGVYTFATYGSPVWIR
jgi:L,D-transpeptidase-like protein/putative peptidoglycan binding protein